MLCLDAQTLPVCGTDSGLRETANQRIQPQLAAIACMRHSQCHSESLARSNTDFL